MVVITPKRSRKANIDEVTIKNSDLFWIKMNDVQQGLGVKNISARSDNTITEIKGIFNTNNVTPNQIKKCKRSLAVLMNNHS